MTALTNPVELPAWEPKRQAALARLEAFVSSAGRDYAARRNTDTGPGTPAGMRANVSCLSPWLRHRVLLEQEVVARTLQSHSLNGAEKFIAEVFWRTYFKGWMEHRPEVWSVYLSDLQTQAARLEKYNDLANNYTAAINGETGIAPFDAWARELVETNYLHNHARMWFASIWIFTLRLPWQLGADFFIRHLLDGDPASNTLSWRWVGGLHTKGKTYLARASNIAKFTDGRFGDAEQLGWQLANDAPPLEEDFEFEKSALSLPDPAPGAPYILLVTEEDGQPESLALRGQPVHIASANASDGRSPVFDVSDPVMAFSRGCIDDAVARAMMKHDCAHTSLNTSDVGDALVALAKAHDVEAIATAYAPVGPMADRIAGAARKLADAGITLHRVARTYDREAWPHATKGFFGLKKKIPALVKSLGLEGSA